MTRRLIIANTYYQLIISIQMRLTLFSSDEVVLLLSNHSNNSDKIYHNLCKEEVFSQVGYIKTKNLVNSRTRKEKIEDFIDISISRDNRYSFILDEVSDLYFDEIIVYNYCIDTIGVYTYLYNINKDIKVSLFEEGILSYGVTIEDNYRRRLIKSVRKLLGKKDISESFCNFYCYYPALYNGTLKPVEVPSVSNGSSCVEILKRVFMVENKDIDYKQKFFYFSSVYDFEGGNPIGEFDLVKRIADVVGKDKLIIKTHPRDSRGIYESEGFTVDQNSSVPWEVIQLSGDFSDKVFITATSGSVLAGSFISDKPIKTYYMYKLCNVSGNESAQKTSQDIFALLNNKGVNNILDKVRIVNKIEEILE